jgi:hypothetical protein
MMCLYKCYILFVRFSGNSLLFEFCASSCVYGRYLHRLATINERERKNFKPREKGSGEERERERAKVVSLASCFTHADVSLYFSVDLPLTGSY